MAQEVNILDVPKVASYSGNDVLTNTPDTGEPQRVGADVFYAAAGRADDAAVLATNAAAEATTEGDYAQTQGDYAKEQGDYAKTKGDNVQDGKTPKLIAPTATGLDAGSQPTAIFVRLEPDEWGNPQYRLDLGIPKGERGEEGYTPKFVGSQFSQGAPGSAPIVVASLTGTDPDTGQPIYTLTGSIPQGQPGIGSGNVEVDALGIVAGKQYVFVPNSDNTPIGTFQEVIVPDTQVQADWNQTDDEQKDFIKNKPTLATVATSGSYNDLSNTPDISAGNQIVYDVTDMFTTSPNAPRFVARMTGHSGDRKVIELFGQDVSGLGGNLTITASIGFGADQPQSVFIPSSPSANREIQITPETIPGGEESTIVVPSSISRFYFPYFVGTAKGRIKSYYIDTNDVYHNFSASDTPISNFAQSTGSVWVINGTSRQKNTIKEVAFGNNYSSALDFGAYFMYNAPNLENIYLDPFSNINEAREYAISGNAKLKSIDFSLLPSLQRIGAYAFSSNTTMLDIDLSTSNGIQFMGDHAFERCSSLRTIDFSGLSSLSIVGNMVFDWCTSVESIQIGSLDWSNVSVGTLFFRGLSNTSSKILYANSQYLGQAFKSKNPDVFSNWTIIVNG